MYRFWHKRVYRMNFNRKNIGELVLLHFYSTHITRKTNIRNDWKLKLVSLSHSMTLYAFVYLFETLFFSLSLSLSHSVRLISLAFLVLWFCKTYLPVAQKELDIPKYKMNNMCNFVFVGRRCGWCNLKYVFPIPKSQM